MIELLTENVAPVRITFRNLTLTIPGINKVVVDDVSGEIQPATVVAVMGSSGCGKTSLLNALCGRAYYGITTGKV